MKINNKKELLRGQYSYDYLGFPHTTNGIQWKDHLEKSSHKALTILNSIHHRNDVLPPYVRLIIFKTFIRPLMEHGACLAFYWMDENDINKLENINLVHDFKEIKIYNEVINKGIQWIVNHGKISNSSCLLGIPKAMTRLYCLALKFKKHLSKMDKENPLYFAFNPPPHINKFKSPSLAYRCYTTKDLFTRYKYFGTTNESPDTQLSHIDKRINEIIYNEFKQSFVMNKCILPMARVPKDKINTVKENAIVTSPDRCIYLKNHYLREKAIAWRLNKFFGYASCPICGLTFFRDHINNCNFIHHPPYRNIIKETHLNNFKKDKEKFKNFIPPSYNIIDSLLNHQNYYTFGKIIENL